MARFHVLVSGDAWLRDTAGAWTQLEAGDAILLPRGNGHILASSPNVPARPFETMPRHQVCDGVVEVGCSDSSNVFFYAMMRFNLDRMHPLLMMMPDVIRARDLATSESAIPTLLDAMMREVETSRVGSGGILSRLADVLTATIIRTWVENGSKDTSGWLAAVRHPDIGRVLASVHLNPSRDWKVDEMAKLMGSSRSGFALRFAEIVGDSPARYVARLRMHQGQSWLRDGERVAAVAEKLGYDSEASFSRAFKRIIGAPPSRFRGAVR